MFISKFNNVYKQFLSNLNMEDNKNFNRVLININFSDSIQIADEIAIFFVKYYIVEKY